MPAPIILPDADPSTQTRYPRIGYRNIAKDTSGAVITADSTSTAGDYDPSYPFNWKPYNYWMPATGGEHYLDIALPAPQAADYFAIAQHNLGEQHGSIALRYSTDGGVTWQDAVSYYPPRVREQVWWDFDAVVAPRWRIYTTSVNPAALGIAAFGRKYQPYRGQFAGFMVPKLARSVTQYASTSDAGLMLGRSILRKQVKGSIAFDLMELGDAYADWLPFMKEAEKHPFFLVWLLEDWPEDVQLVATDGDWTQPAMTQFGFIGTQINYCGLLQE